MKIKKFVAGSMPEAMKQIKEELGHNAIILNSKEIKPKGFLGLFGKKKIEVTAMLDDGLQTSREAPSKKKLPLLESREASSLSAKSKVNQEEKILEEIKYLQSILASQTSSGKEVIFPPLLQDVYQYLLKQEVEADIAKSIVEALADQANEEALTRDKIKQLLYELVEARLNEASYEGIDKETKVVQFVGPTGVGKTTTIAKVAANHILQDGKSVAFITADTYRIAAIEQLKTYATILNVPIEVVYSKEDYDRALQKFSKYDLIFVDTAGRNYREKPYLNELKHFISTPTVATETFLVLSLTAKASDIQHIYHQFRPLQINQVIFTKIDETDTYGAILSLIVKNKLKLAYLTNGQNVPEDLLEPKPSELAKLLLRRYSDA